MFTFTETPLKDIWEYIKFLSIENNCKKLLKGEIQSKRELIYTDENILIKKSKEISMSLKQAHEYFIASETVSINTSPLLLFYGMLALSKALIVANKENVFLNDIKYHGLETKPRYDYLKTYNENPANWSLEHEFAITNSGVFHYLMEILDGFTLPHTSVIEFKDILRCIPELRGLYEKYYNEFSNVLNVGSINETQEDDKYKLNITILGEVDKIIELIPQIGVDFDIDPPYMRNQKARTFKAKNLLRFPEYLGSYFPQFGGKYLIKGIQYFSDNEYKQKYIQLESLDYVGLFILSICVRYKQVLWGQIISGENSGSIGLINLYINSMKRRFPNKILNKLFNEDFIYGSAAYLQ